MSFLKGWKMKSPTATMPNTVQPISAFNPSGMQSQMTTPETDNLKTVSPVATGMSKFRGLKRLMAKDRNMFKESKD